MMPLATLLILGATSFQGGHATTTTTAACTGDDTIDCQCMYQGAMIPLSIINNYPTSNPGQYASSRTVRLYGTTCAAWDQMPETPWYSSCDASTVTDWSVEGTNWCQVPWCYVSPCCSTYTASSVFTPASFGYSYETCGGKNCYGSAFNDAANNCPYDPASEGDYKTHKSSCPCQYQGALLATSTYTNYPTSNPGAHQNLANIASYGTTCAAWDSMPGMPWFSMCPVTADFCAVQYNWCRAPWCYVESSCSTFVASSVFAGSPSAGYSYDTCGAPNCYTSTNVAADAAAACPFDNSDSMWGGLSCPNGFTGGSSTGNMESSKATTTGLAAAAALATASCMASDHV